MISAGDFHHGLRVLAAALAGATLAVGSLAAAEVGTAGKTGTAEPPQMTGRSPQTVGRWDVSPLLTVGERTDDGESLHDSAYGYTLPGVLDGIAAFPLADGATVRLFVSHELAAGAGPPYDLANGARLRGARITAVDVDRCSRRVLRVGLAYRAAVDRFGEPVAVDGAGFSRFCSSQGVRAGERGFVDSIYFTGEERSGGQETVTDVEGGVLYVAPALGRAAFENVTALDNRGSDKVVLLIGDDRTGAPLLLYLGRKGSSMYPGAPSFLSANGLADGSLYVWVADGPVFDPNQFHGTGSVQPGGFVRIEHFDPTRAGMPGYDRLGFADQATQDAAARAAGAFELSRPEDVATDPADGSRAVLAATGSAGRFPVDSWGTVYRIDVGLGTIDLAQPPSSIDRIPAELTILYDGDDAGGGRFASPDLGMRNPDNLDWGDGFVYLSEDRTFDRFGTVGGIEASVWQLDPATGDLVRILEMDRSAVPDGQFDSAPGVLGAWESSGVLEVTEHFARSAGETVLVLDVQAHSSGGLIGTQGLVQGGQLLLASHRRLVASRAFPSPAEGAGLVPDRASAWRPENMLACK